MDNQETVLILDADTEATEATEGSESLERATEVLEAIFQKVSQ